MGGFHQRLASEAQGNLRLQFSLFHCLISLSQAAACLDAPMGPQMSDCEILSDAMGHRKSI